MVMVVDNRGLSGNIRTSWSDIRMLSSHLERSSVACPDSVFDDNTKFTVFQLVNSRCSCSCRRCYHISKNSRVLASFHSIECRSQKCVVDERSGSWPRESHVDSGINHRLHQQENVSRSTSTDGCAHINKFLIVDVNLIFIEKRQRVSE